MHYFPSTFDEISGFLIEYRQRRIMAGEKNPQLACVMGRFQRREFENSQLVKDRIYFHGIEAWEGSAAMLYLNVEIHFDQASAWRFEIGTKKPGTTPNP